MYPLKILKALFTYFFEEKMYYIYGVDVHKGTFRQIPSVRLLTIDLTFISAIYSRDYSWRFDNSTPALYTYRPPTLHFWPRYRTKYGPKSFF